MENGRTLPFLNRDMLNFEHGLTFSLQIRSQANVTATLLIKGMTREGTFTLTHRTVSTGVPQVETFRIPDIPIMVSVTEPIGFISQGACYVVMNLLAGNDTIQELAAGLVYQNKGISYPNQAGPNHRPNQGLLTELSSTDPAAGSEITLSFSEYQTTHIIAGRFTLVTSATVASRRVHLVFGSAGGISFDAFSDVDQLLSTTIRYTFGAFPSMPASSNDNDILIPIPPNLILRGGGSISTATVNRQAGDDFTSMEIICEQFWDET